MPRIFCRHTLLARTAGRHCCQTLLTDIRYIYCCQTLLTDNTGRQCWERLFSDIVVVKTTLSDIVIVHKHWKQTCLTYLFSAAMAETSARSWATCSSTAAFSSLWERERSRRHGCCLFFVAVRENIRKGYCDFRTAVKTYKKKVNRSKKQLRRSTKRWYVRIQTNTRTSVGCLRRTWLG